MTRLEHLGWTTMNVDVEPVAPDSAEAHRVLVAYFGDLIWRRHGREATRGEIDAAISADSSEDLCPPRGVLFVARRDGVVLGCSGLRLITAETGEVTRVFVLPHARRRGVAQLLLEAVEAAAREQNMTRLRLDTSSHLTEAQHLYVKNGYQETAPFSDNGICDRWYQKFLT